jgi:drug/metabolite transporter (DMT)-like permease
MPGSATTLASAALACGSVAALWVLVFPLRSVLWTPRRDLWSSVVGGGLAIAGPLVGLVNPQGLSAGNLMMAFALTPVVLAVAEAARGDSRENLAGRLWPGLAAVAGLLLLLPQPVFGSAGSDVVLVIAPLLTGCGAALFCSADAGVWRMPAALCGAAVVLGIAALAVFHRGHVWPEMLGLAAGLDAVEALLTILVLERLSAARWSAQFVVVPLVILVESFVILRESLSPRGIGGLLLLAGASAALLAPPVEDTNIEVVAPRKARPAEP